MRRARAPIALVLLLAVLAGCTSIPDGAYFPEPNRPETIRVAHALHKAAHAAGDDPTRYSFALVAAPQLQAWAAGHATLYVTDALARMPAEILEPLVAHEVAHEVLGHLGKRQAVSLSITTGFAVLGVLVPGSSLADLIVNPLVIRAYSREHELAADQRAVEILRAMGYAAPRRALHAALRTADARNGKLREEGGPLATHPPMAERLARLEPLEDAPLPLAETLAQK
jgi:Zn-dependent protease with chaperone function